MKTLYIFLFLNVFSVLSYSQELNLNDVIYLYENRDDFKKCRSYLSNIKFKYIDGDESEGYVFSYNQINKWESKAIVTIKKDEIFFETVTRLTLEYLGDNLNKEGIVATGMDSLGDASYWSFHDGKHSILLLQGKNDGTQSRTGLQIRVRGL